MSATVHIHSFGFRRSGMPADTLGNGGGFVFDCRFLPNPVYVPDLSALSGMDDAVVAYLSEFSAVRAFVEHVCAIVDSAVEVYQVREYENLHVSFGCTGGQHRSVYCAERLAEHLRERALQVNLIHTEKGLYW